jgi:hypothetical protein
MARLDDAGRQMILPSGGIARYQRPSIVDGGQASVHIQGAIGHSVEAFMGQLPGTETRSGGARTDGHSDPDGITSQQLDS